MKKDIELDPLAPRPGLDFSKGIRGKHYAQMQAGTNLILFAPDLLDTFPDSEAVNEALRSLKKRSPPRLRAPPQNPQSSAFLGAGRVAHAPRPSPPSQRRARFLAEDRHLPPGNQHVRAPAAICEPVQVHFPYPEDLKHQSMS